MHGSFWYLQVPSSMASQIGNGASSRAPQARKTRKEVDDAQRVKDQRAKLSAQSQGGTSTNTTCLAASNEPRIVQEARKRREVDLEGEMANPTKDNRLVRMFNNQGREEVETRVARAIYACGIPFNVVWSPYW